MADVNKSESKIQQECFVWYNNTFCLEHHKNRQLIFHVANEGQHRLIGIGVLAGVSDLILTIKGNVYFCEVKDYRGKQARKQKEFEERVSILGFEYVVIRSLDEFKDWVLSKM